MHLLRLVPDHLLGRVFGDLYGAIGVAAAVSYIAAAVSYIGGGLLLDATSAPTTFLVAGAAGTLATGATGTLATVAVAATLPRSRPGSDR
ncbi:MAG: hypothetical protein ACRDRK_11755 [Pseudonocardia sp.]